MKCNACRWVVLAVLILSGSNRPAHATPGLPGDYNGDGQVTHADYSVLGDTFGSFDLRADGDFNGIVDATDFLIYSLNYGSIASSPSFLGFLVGAVPTPDGNLEWTIAFDDVNGAVAAHMNITTSGPNVLSVTPGPLFQDDGFGAVGVPGFNAANVIEQGVSFSGNQAYAALGTTLTISPSLLNSDSTLEFVKLVTEGAAPMVLNFSGEYGYQGLDYFYGGSAGYGDGTVPEPAAALLLGMAVVGLTFSRKRWRGTVGR